MREKLAPLESEALFTDLYQLTMMECYVREKLDGTAVFDLFARRLPPRRNYLLAAGLSDVLDYLDNLRFTSPALRYLESLNLFSSDFLKYLSSFRFSGDVDAVAEGTPVFPEEPILQVRAPLPEAQLVETFVLNQVHFQTLAASKASRVVAAAAGRPVVDFGMRRMHGKDAAMKAARSFSIAGVEATSNVLAGQTYGLRLSGTMAHSYVEAFDDEIEAFRVFNKIHPRGVLLVDTYDTLQGVRRVVRLARELGDDFRVEAIRLDSGDLAALACASRRILDRGGLNHVGIFVSGSLDEDAIADLVGQGAPITGFGVGTRMGVSADAPYVDSAYKLVEYAGQGRMKLSTGKQNLPGSKQVFRVDRDGTAVFDIIAQAEESLPGSPLLEPVMRGGVRLPSAERSLLQSRSHAQLELAKLPAAIRSLEAAPTAYRVDLSPALRSAAQVLRHRLASKQGLVEERQ